MNNKTGNQSPQDVVFNKYPIFTPLFIILPKYNTPPPMIIPTYPLHCGPGCHTSAAYSIGGGKVCVGTIETHAYLCSRCDFCHVFCLCPHVIFSHDPECFCRNDHIRHSLPTDHPVNAFRVHSVGDTTRYVRSRISDPHHCHSSATSCERPSHIPPCREL